LKNPTFCTKSISVGFFQSVTYQLIFAYNFNHSLRKKGVAIAYVGSYVNKQLHDNVKKLIREII